MEGLLSISFMVDNLAQMPSRSQYISNAPNHIDLYIIPYLIGKRLSNVYLLHSPLLQTVGYG